MFGNKKIKQALEAYRKRRDELLEENFRLTRRNDELTRKVFELTEQ